MISTRHGLAVGLAALFATACPQGDDDDGAVSSSGGGGAASSSSAATSSPGPSSSGPASSSSAQPSSRGSSSASWTASSGPCASPLECPGQDSACATRTCQGGRCGMAFTAANVPVGSQVPGDCHALVCDGEGSVASRVDDTDHADDHNDCTEDRCRGGEALHEPLAPGTACSAAGGVFCSDGGQCIQCETAGDCASTVCRLNRCVDATCGDRVKNGSESDEDCGGPDCLACGPYLRCLEDQDCRGGSCVGQRCVPTCTDGAVDGDETDVDCGGPTCPRCAVGQGCLLGTDCASAVCGAGRMCAAPSCGDGLVNGVEQCDDGNAATERCPYGLMGCTVCNSQCARGPGTTAFCGDNQVNGPESCDDGNTATEPCHYGVSTCQVCASDCTLQYGATAYCGDGAVNGDEGCDQGGGNTNGCGYGERSCTVCNLSCQLGPGQPAFCGDGAVNGAEQCDDGNTVTEGCTYAVAQCTVCDATCRQAPGRLSRCGDGEVSGPEQCDDGNRDTETCAYGDPQCVVCDAACLRQTGSARYCGDGTVNGPEQCDDGNTATESCPYGSRACTVCNASCRSVAGATAYCGDRALNGGEACDDGNLQTPACPYGQREGGCTVCTPECASQAGALAYCGNGSVDLPDETCDDGNAGSEPCAYGKESCTVCDATCHDAAGATSYCGDGRLEPGRETCDDGNRTGGDCCSPECQREANCEVEPNATAAEALAAGRVFPSSGVIKGSIVPAGDVDVIPVEVTQVIDLTVESFASVTPGQCAAADTFLELLDTDGATVLASDDEDGPNSCSRIDPALGDVGAAGLVPGTYFVVVHKFRDNGDIPLWGITVAAAAVCGNAAVEGAEQCDDGNLASGDDCDSRCRLESDPEAEPNDLCPQASGPVALPRTRVLAGALDPAGDSDWWSFTLAATSDVRITTWDGNGPGNCAGIDTAIQLYADDCSTPLGEIADDTDAGLCAALDPASDAQVRHLPAGTYRVEVFSPIGQAIAAYALRLELTATCADGVVEGFEQCDGTPRCDATCTREPWCGDGFVDGTEQCDDRNTDGGDGCSAACQWEPGRWCGDGIKITTEQCDDGNLAAGDGCDAACTLEDLFTETEENYWWEVIAGQRPLTLPSSTVLGSINHSVLGIPAYAPNTDQDFFNMVVPTATVVRLEVFDGTGADCAGTADPKLELYSGVGTQLFASASANDNGIGKCPALVTHLAGGSYILSVYTSAHSGTANPAQVFGAYRYQARAVPSAGSEVEPNDTYDKATHIPGLEAQVWASHQRSTDIDWFSVDVPPGRSLRAEVVEGGDKICESNSMDSYMFLFSLADGQLLVEANDRGRGHCTLIDGTGAAPLDAGAHALAGGRYLLAVRSLDPQGEASKFDYRLVVTIR